MRSRALPSAVAAAAFAALVGCGGHRDAAADACARAGCAGGSSAIDREVVAAGIDQDCVAFNQFVGAGFNAIPGYVAGECFGAATVSVRGRLKRTTRRAPRYCRLGRPRSTDPGPAPPSIPA